MEMEDYIVWKNIVDSDEEITWEGIDYEWERD